MAALHPKEDFKPVMAVSTLRNLNLGCFNLSSFSLFFFFSPILWHSCPRRLQEVVHIQVAHTLCSWAVSWF